MKQLITLGLFLLLLCSCKDKTFVIADGDSLADIIVAADEWPGVTRAAGDLCDDVERVTGRKPLLANQYQQGSIVAGTIGHSQIIDSLIKAGRLDVREIEGQWESYLIEEIDGALVIAGSDRRGTIYGIYTISEHIGVSPWYWWADAPVAHQESLTYNGKRMVQPSPKVKYRGIFINDEWPSFGTWATNHFGGVNSKMYSHMFELLLRLKANYLWPAMWDSRFNEEHDYSRKTEGRDSEWRFLPDLGRGKGNMGVWPVTAQSCPEGDGAVLEYDIDFARADSNKLALGILPTNDINPARGLRIGIRIDNGEMQTIDARQGYVDTFSEYTSENIARSKVLKPLPQPASDIYLSGYRQRMRSEVFDNLRWLSINLSIPTVGKHTLKVVMIDPEIVVEKLVINPDNEHPSYHGRE